MADASGQHHGGKALRGDVVYDEGKVGKAADFSGETQVSFGNTGDFDRSDRFALALWARTASTHPIKIIQKRDSAEQWQGYEIATDDPTFHGVGDRLAHFVVRLAAKWPDDAIEVRTIERYKTTSFSDLVVNYDGSGKAQG